MQQDRDSESPLPTRQSRIHSPTMAAFSPHFGGLPDWKKNWQWKKTSDQSYQHLLFLLHFMYGIQFGFMRTLFYLKLCCLRTPTGIVGIKSAQFRLSVTS